ncbi:MAG: TraR/DksA C4-type zinc finger protein [Prolixibacteraceae bacterium]|nr:TraR/DksA C4-type zinc finger protein [Prolixibacteraceae bacterium]
MDSEFQNQVLELLQNKRAKLERDIADLEESTQAEAPDSAIGRVSRMDSINNRSVNEATLRKKRLQLTKIDAALKEVGKPGFGLCIRCGNPIPVQRILLMPESKVCVACAR